MGDHEKAIYRGEFPEKWEGGGGGGGGGGLEQFADLTGGLIRQSILW